jgi:hypothetical protein
MKKIIFFTVLLLIMTLAINNLIAQISCYDDNGSNCSDWSSTSTTIYLPEHPSCPLTVLYKSRTCDEGTQIYIEQIFADLQSPNCDGIKNQIWPNGMNEPVSWGGVANLYKSAYRQLSYIIFLSETSGLSDAEKDNYLCGSGYYVTTHTYFRDICHKYCLKLEWGPSFPKVWIVERMCTDQYCCDVMEQYCYNKIWDPIQGKFVYYPNVIETQTPEANINCEEINPIDDPCPQGYQFFSTCFSTCGE